MRRRRLGLRIRFPRAEKLVAPKPAVRWVAPAGVLRHGNLAFVVNRSSVVGIVQTSLRTVVAHLAHETTNSRAGAPRTRYFRRVPGRNRAVAWMAADDVAKGELGLGGLPR